MMKDPQSKSARSEYQDQLMGIKRISKKVPSLEFSRKERRKEQTIQLKLFITKQLRRSIINIENRKYIRVEFRESLGMNFFSPFQPEREFKVYK